MPRIFSLILLIGLLGAPLRAQDPPQLQYAQPVEGSLAPDQTDTFTWIGSAGDRPVIVMNAKGGEIDPLLRLYNPAGQLIGEDQDSNGKRNARIENLVLAESGTYIVEARNAGPGGGAYSLIIHERDQVIHYHGGDEVPYTGEVAGHDHDHAYHYELSRPWPDTHITYTIVNTLPGFEESAVREVIVYGLQAWANNTPLTFQEVDDQNAHIVIQFDRIDGSSQVLGQACPPSSPCAGSVVFDSEENWVLYEPTRYDDISLLGVATHEFGHALGLLHSDDASALMYPSYSPYVLQPTDDDIRGIQRLYGSGRGTVYNPTSVPGASGSDGQPVVQGTISDDQFVHFWDFDAYAGEVITIRMEARSGGLDPFIFILDANDQILAYDDDSGPDQDAIVRNITFPFDGTYTVAATRYQQVFGYSVGDYRLTITYGATEAPPDDDEDRDSERPSPFPTPG
nr:matrixin family metalloprotease [Anaerolineae bacterium]